MLNSILQGTVRTAQFAKQFSLYLLAGTFMALVWANVDWPGYHHFQHWLLMGSTNVTVHFVVNDVLMAIFFAVAGKEVWEAMALENGKLRGFRKAATPLLATLGGVVVPAAVYLTVAYVNGDLAAVSRGWGVVVATDIAFAILIARLVFGGGHPAIAFLLLLAIADDAIGLVIIAVVYPQGDIQVGWLVLTFVAVALGYGCRALRLHSFWWYLLIPGSLSWLSFYWAGIHPALGLLPIIPTMPHAETDLGIFVREELSRRDTLNQFEHWWAGPTEAILFLFGLTNAGVVFSQLGPVTWYVVTGLLLGKTLGVTLFTWVGVACGLELPQGIRLRDVPVIGSIAGVGFTVALFMTVAAFVPGPVQDAAKMGALFSFGAFGLALLMAYLLRVGRFSRDPQVVEVPTLVESH